MTYKNIVRHGRIIQLDHDGKKILGEVVPLGTIVVEPIITKPAPTAEKPKPEEELSFLARVAGDNDIAETADSAPEAVEKLISTINKTIRSENSEMKLADVLKSLREKA